MASRADKELIIRAQAEKRRRALQAPLKFYEPHEGQRRFHDAQKTHRVVILHPGNRFGKSTANAAEIVAHLYGYRPWEVPGLQLTPEGDYPPREAVPVEYWVQDAGGIPLHLPALHLCVSGLPARQGILATMFPKIEEFLPQAVRTHPDYNVQRGAQSVPVSLQLPPTLSARGSKVLFGSGEQDSMAFEAQAFTSASFDEPPKRVIWPPVWRGLVDHYGRLWCTATPVGPNVAWIYETFVQHPDDLGVPIMVLGGSIWENPHVSSDAKKEFLSGGGFDPETLQARESGAWPAGSHLAFPGFSHAVHVVPRETAVPPGSIIVHGCDPAHRRPYAFVWGAWHGDELLIFDEWPNQDHSKINVATQNIRDYAKILADKELGLRVSARAMDPRFGPAAPRVHGEVLVPAQEAFAELGYYYDCEMAGAEKEEYGIEIIRQMLAWRRDRPLSTENRPRLRVRANCINTINALAYSSFVASRDPDVLPLKITERFKDFRDALRYMVLIPTIPSTQVDEGSYITERELRDHNNGWF